MAQANDYQVTFPYGGVDGYYYTASRPHRGSDRPCPSGTLITIGATTIGYTGASGLVSGPHLHTQAGTDEWCQVTVDPEPYEFQPGTVVHTGHASQWGNYIIMRTDNGAYVCYAHLSQVDVSPGQRVVASTNTGGSAVELIKSMYLRLVGREADQDGINHYSKQAADKGWDFVYSDLKNSAEGQRDWQWRNPSRVRELEKQAAQAPALAAQLTAVSAQLAETKVVLQNEQDKPPVEVIREVEKIVEKPVEVIKTVEVPADERKVVEGWFSRLWSGLFKK